MIWVPPSEGVLEVDVVCFDDPEEVCVRVFMSAHDVVKTHHTPWLSEVI